MTTYILWQIWKGRNELEFEGKYQQQPLKTLNKAQVEWMEHEDAMSKQSSQSTTETAVLEIQHQERQGAEFVKQLRFKMASDPNKVGIGLIATTGTSQIVVCWAITERSTGCKIADEATAVKLALCKAAEKQWQDICIYIPNKELLQLLDSQRPRSSILATLVDDIVNLKLLF